MKKKMSRRGRLAAAILWTVIVGLWLVTFILRLRSPFEDTSLLVLTAFTLLAGASTAVANWLRYIHYEE